MITDIRQKINKNLMETPQQTAIMFNGKTTTYGTLEKYSSAIMQQIIDALGHTEEINLRNVSIGVHADRNECLIACITAIIRLGATYVPIEPQLPPGRKRYIRNNSGMCLIITDRKDKNDWNENQVPVLEVNFASGQNLSFSSPQSAQVVPRIQVTEPSGCAYIIYTSGTTGWPKGVAISYNNLNWLATNIVRPEAYNITSQSRCLAFSSIGFDSAIIEIIVTLAAGATIILAGEEHRTDANLLHKLIKEQRVTMAFLVPSLLACLPDLDFPYLHTLAFGAEQIAEKLFNRIRQYPYRLINAYGPTENSVCSTLHIVNKSSTPNNIGKPLDGVLTCVLDENYNSVPEGSAGQLYLAGQQLSGGYLPGHEHTQNPFIDNLRGDGVRYYRTGDKVRILPGGDLCFEGRYDSQIKINGFRIEPTEISKHLNKNDMVERAFVKVVGTNDTKRLGVYIQPRKDVPFDLDKLKTDLRTYLPHYMIPGKWKIIDAFPRTLNDKIDENALPPFDSFVATNSAAAQRGEAILCNLLQQILNLPAVSVEADLINDLGMTSLDILRFVSLLSEEGYIIPVTSVYQQRTVRGILSTPSPKPIYWYREPQPHRPVVILVCGAAYFNFLYFQFAHRLHKKYDILVIDAIYTHFDQNANNVEQLIEYYYKAITPHIRNRNIYALTGFCIGSELALLLACKLYNAIHILPKVIALDAQACRLHSQADSYPLLIFPGEEKGATQKRDRILRTYLRTVPFTVYQGEIKVYLSAGFCPRPTLLNSDECTPQQQKLLKQEYDNTEKLWNILYPGIEIKRLPANHWTFFEEEPLNVLLSEFLSLLDFNSPQNTEREQSF